MFAAAFLIWSAGAPNSSRAQNLPQQQTETAAPQHLPIVVVLDPGHGGADSGAHGSNGVVEKDIALAVAKATRAELLQQGFHAILTREGDENPSFDDRAAMANYPRWALLVSFHLSSTGRSGTVRAYSYQFSAPESPAGPSGKSAAAPVAPVASGLISWDDAQRPYVDSSHRFADLIQVELAQKFPGSPSTSSAFAIRDLRSVAAPAVAIEISSVTAKDSSVLDALVGPLADAVTRGITAYRPIYEAGAK